MVWKKGVSGNPAGKALMVARKLVDAGIQPNEQVYIPILDKRDPTKELINLADSSKDPKFKRDIWQFLFTEKYKGYKFCSKPTKIAIKEEMSDADMIRALEENRPVESKPDALQSDRSNASDKTIHG
jgi:hypothetical protein